MNLAAKLDRFRDDNPYDIATQAKRLLASKDDELIHYCVELGLNLARTRQRHDERQYIKDTGFVRMKETIKPGRVTGSIIVKPSKKTTNALRRFVMETWMINGEQKLGDATAADLGEAIKRENASVNGHRKNIQFYGVLRKPIEGSKNPVRDAWNEQTLRSEIENVYGEFRSSEAA